MNNDDFLSSILSIDEFSGNLAEYSMLVELYRSYPNDTFLLEIVNLSTVKYYYTDLISYINSNYKSHCFQKFSLLSDGQMEFMQLNAIAGSSLNESEIFNLAINLSRKNSSYILVKSMKSLVLYYQGNLDTGFNHIYEDRKKIEEFNNEKKGIDQLEWVFENYRVERKHIGCNFISDGKIVNDITEQALRNDLVKYLNRKTKLFVTTELCTSQKKDEESVDIGLIDADKRVAIIEVKFFITKGNFVDKNKKTMYSINRFMDGYIQLNRYCNHLNKDDYILHSAYLYMFYSHSCSYDEMKERALKILNQFKIDKKDDCILFLKHYKNTIIDNLLEKKDDVLV